MEEIKIDTTIADLLNNYKGMKDILIGINPKFKKLNNPILRRTLAKLATVKQAAIIGGMKPEDLLNQLRVAVGQEPISLNLEDETSSDEIPAWAEQKAVIELNANELLDADKNPLAEVSKALKKLNSGETLALIADFKPEPLIEEFEKQGLQTATVQEGGDRFITKILKI